MESIHHIRVHPVNKKLQSSPSLTHTEAHTNKQPTKQRHTHAHTRVSTCAHMRRDAIACSASRWLYLGLQQRF